MSSIRAVKHRSGQQPRRTALLLGLPGLAIALLATTGATAALAAQPPAGKATVPVASVPVAAVPGPATPAPHYPMPRKAPARTTDTSCDDIGFAPILGSFTASATTVPVGAAVALTATMACDIGPTPYWLQVFDTITGEMVLDCGSGTSCVGPDLTQSAAGVHNYVAYLGPWITSYPPTSVFEKSINIFITWEAPPNNFTVSLSGPSLVTVGEGPGTFTATVNQDVGPTPYWTEIFDESNGTLLGECQSGITCSIEFTPPAQAQVDLVAFVSSLSGALPPSNAQASSNVLPTFGAEPIT